MQPEQRDEHDDSDGHDDVKPKVDDVSFGEDDDEFDHRSSSLKKPKEEK